MTNQHPFLQEDTKILQRIPKEILLLSLIGAFITAFSFDIMAGVLFLTGGIFSTGSFVWLKDSLAKFFLPNNRKKMIGSILGSYLLRLLLIMVAFSIIIIFFSEKVIAFVAGFSIIVLVFLAEAIIALPKIKKWKN